MSMAISSFVEYNVRVGAVFYAPPYDIILGSEKMKSDKELFGLAQMYVTLEEEFKMMTEHDLSTLGEVKRSLENISNTLFQKGYDIDKFLRYQEMYRKMSIGEYIEFIKTLE